MCSTIRLRNTLQRYGWVAILLHWLMAAVLIVLLGMGLYMVRLPDVGFDTRKIAWIVAHKQIGLFALTLTVLRLAWRVGNVLPELVETIPEWQRVIARLVHLCFYALMFALPVSGWLMSSAAGIPVSLLGVWQMPDLVATNEALFESLVEVHRWLAYALVVNVMLHAGAAFRHHLVLKDQTLRKMWPAART